MSEAPGAEPERKGGADDVGASGLPGGGGGGKDGEGVGDGGSARAGGEAIAGGGTQGGGGDDGVETFDVPDSSKVVPIAYGSIEKRQEWTRAILAVLFVLLLSTIVIWSFIRASGWEETKELLDVVLPAVTGLLGSAVGFYFATKR